MGRITLRSYKGFVAALFLSSFLIGSIFGFLSLRYTPEEEIVRFPEAVGVTTAVDTLPSVSFDEPAYQEYVDGLDEKSFMGFRLYDVDGDGLEELLIDSSGYLYDIVTIRDGRAESILQDHTLFLCENGIVGKYISGSGASTLFFYKIENQTAVAVECIVWEFEEDAWYRSVDHSGDWSTMIPITDAEHKKIIEQYPLVEKPSANSILYFVYEKAGSPAS